MATDRSADRHKTANYPYRPTPSDLLKQLDETVGPGRRSAVMSVLLRRFLAGGSMPTVAEVLAESDKPGHGNSA